MKRTLSVLLLALLGVAGALRADTVIPPITLANQAGTSLPSLSSYTSLGCVTVGAATSSVNLTATGGLLYVVTGTSQVLVQWATGTGPWYNSLLVSGSGFLSKQGDLVRFVGSGSNTHTAYSCISYRTVSPDGPSVFSGSVSVTSTGAISSSVPLTIGAFVNSAGTTMDQLTTSAASLGAYTAISRPAFTLTTYTATTINVTNYAGVSGLYDIAIMGNFGGAALRAAVTFSSTAPADLSTRGQYVATTATTQIRGLWGPGAHLHMIGVGSASVDATAELCRMQRLAP